MAEAVKALSLCHNVTPVFEGDADDTASEADRNGRRDGGRDRAVTYQAASPDEVALVQWSEEVGLTLVDRDLHSMKLRAPTGDILGYTILQIFPFTSESKRMGIILQDDSTGERVFYLKGADIVMSSIVQYNDWLEEEVDNMAREGLRTLVVAKKSLTPEQYHDFEQRYHSARLSVANRSAQVAAVVESLERDMELLCVTGVEDKLQENVRNTLEVVQEKWGGGFVCVWSFDAFFFFFLQKKGFEKRWRPRLDADGGQAGDGHLHRQELQAGGQAAGHPRVQATGEEEEEDTLESL